jgi:hypothetical protein
LKVDICVSTEAAGGIELVLNLLRSGDPHAQENATTALWNAMVDNEKSRIELIKNKGMPLLIQQLVAGTPVGQELAAGAIWKSCANDPSLKEEAKSAIPGLVSLLRTGTDAAKEHAAGALRSACINSAPNKAELNRVNGIAALMEVIQTASARAREQAGAALANACANSIQNQVLFFVLLKSSLFFVSSLYLVVQLDLCTVAIRLDVKMFFCNWGALMTNSHVEYLLSLRHK